MFSLLNSTFVHTQTESTRAVWIEQCHSVTIANTSMKFANQNLTGLAIQGSTVGLRSRLSMYGCQFDGSFDLPSVVLMSHYFPATIQNCIFSNNTGGISVVTANDEQSCPPDQICHSLSYYISQSDFFFTSDTTIVGSWTVESIASIRNDIVQVSNVHDLTLRGQGQWPVAGPEETEMESTVVINCNRRKGGGFLFT